MRRRNRRRPINRVAQFLAWLRDFAHRYRERERGGGGGVGIFFSSSLRRQKQKAG